MSEVLELWEPIEGMPELPVATFNFDWRNDDILNLTVIFAPLLDGENFPAARFPATIVFSSVRAFKLYDEELDPYSRLDFPRFEDQHSVFATWPFLQVKNSAWLRRLIERDHNLDRPTLRHWLLTGLDMHLHIAAFGSAPKMSWGTCETASA